MLRRLRRKVTGVSLFGGVGRRGGRQLSVERASGLEGSSMAGGMIRGFGYAGSADPCRALLGMW